MGLKEEVGISFQGGVCSDFCGRHGDERRSEEVMKTVLTEALDCRTCAASCLP